MIKNLLLLLAMPVFLSSCWGFGNRTEYQDKTPGYKPIYSNDPTLLQITVETARPVKNAGKIYVLGNLLFQNEIGEGIHVIDKTNPNQLINKGFIRIKGNSEISIKGSYLYANSFTDLVVVDVSNWNNPKEVKRVAKAFQPNNFTHQPNIPVPEKNAYAQCVDPTKGVHTGWEKDTVYFNDCFFTTY